MSPFYDDNNDTDSILKEITENLSKQVSEELDQTETIVDFSPPSKGKKTLSKTKKILIALGGVLVVLILGVALAGNYFLGRLNYERPEDVVVVEDPTIEKGEEEEIDLKNIEPTDSSVINILLIGEEKMKDTTRGRSDSMMIATINQKQKALKLTSLMRDCYVTIPGHGHGKLNSAYNIGGGPLLVETIEQNFEVHLDGYARVDFSAFETIVDKLGGVDIELTEAEASYLNRTDYISDPKQRNVVTGMNHMSGSQALGYARVRYKKAGSGESDDFGRTYRQRTVLSAIFAKYKTKNLIELVGITNELLDYITTDRSKTDILGYVAAAVGTGMSDLETFRIPMNNSYSTSTVKSAGSVLLVNFEKNNAALQEYIYGVGENAETEAQTDGQNNEQANASASSQ